MADQEATLYYVSRQLFDTSYYNEQKPDVVKAGMNPLEHYIFKGYSEDFDARDPNALFDSSYYRANNPDVVKAGINPLEHYLRYGWRESLPNNPGGTNPNRDPNALFDTEFYFKIYEDVRLAALTDPSKNPLQHYLEFGQTDAIKRITHPIFLSENQLEFKTVITPGSEGFAFAQNEFRKLNFELTPRENGGIQIAQRTLEGGFDLVGVGKAIVYSVFAGVSFLIKERSLPGILYEANQGGNVYENFFVGFENLELPPLPFPGQKEAPISVESFPNGKQINDILNTDGRNIFTTPTTPILDDPDVVTFPQRDEILEGLLNGPFVFPNDTEIPQGLYIINNGQPFAGTSQNIIYDLGIARELKVADIVGGFKVVDPDTVKRDLKVFSLDDPSLGLKIDVAGSNNELILVGGGIKAANENKLIGDLRNLKRIADSRNLKAQAYFADNTPQKALDIAVAELGIENVFTFPDATRDDFQRLNQLEIIKDNIEF